MQLTEQIIFPPFRLDVLNEQLWREDQLVPVRPKTFAVLRFLVENAGRLLTKEEVLKGVWPNTRVGEGILKGYMRDLRDLLGDDSQQPRFIETVPRRGHRFIGKVVSREEETRSWRLETSPHAPQVSSLQSLASRIVGRDVELAHLQRLFEKALTGERQIVFVTGEPGIGKTTLVEEFLFGVIKSSEFGVADSSESKIPNSELPSTPNPELPSTPNCLRLRTAFNSELPSTPNSELPCGWVAASAWSSTARVRRTCRCSKPWGGLDEQRMASSSSRCCISMPRRGWCKCPRWWERRS